MNDNIILNSELNSLSTPSKVIIDTFKDKLYNGEVDPLKLAIGLKKMQKTSEELFKDETFKSFLFAEVKKNFNGKSYEGFGMKITERATRTWYNFENCEDPYWNALEKISKEIEALKKEREEQLKALIPNKPQVRANLAIANTDTVVTIAELPELTWIPSGEQVTIKPPIKYQADSLVFTEDKEK